ncbi:MAG TPA: class I SAM-dependent methyltransferase [Actinomycetota bacterium]|jgi:SAM-dependent methyltransferase|nr:class I SAM-dependent methyltransferase [Actinomycetota bacterium]
MAARIEEVRKIVARMDDPRFAVGLDMEELDPRTGYAASAPGYDSAPNPLIEAEQPVVEQLLADVPSGRALDAACGTGRHAKHLSATHETFGVDASPEMLAMAREAAPSATFETGDLEALPFPDGHFDVVVCALALCHLTDITKAVCEIGRVARGGAKVVLTDPHPTNVAIISHLFVPTTEGGLGFVRNHPRSLGDYLRAIEAAELRVVQCLEPATLESAFTGGIAGRFLAGAMRQALQGLPQAIIWDLEKAI